MRDYARIYGLRTIVFRQSCIYGPRQMGVEDQGWLAWFIIAVVTGRPITIYGNGKQVRDLLYVDDLVDAYELAVDQIETTAGPGLQHGWRRRERDLGLAGVQATRRSGARAIRSRNLPSVKCGPGTSRSSLPTPPKRSEIWLGPDGFARGRYPIARRLGAGEPFPVRVTGE